METRAIVGLLILISNLLSVLGANLRRENVTNSGIGSNEVNEYSVDVPKNYKISGTRPALKIPEKLFESDGESSSELDTEEESDPIEEGNRKILRFGKRVFESIKKHGLMAEDVRLLKSGNYQIDWWKHSRRLEGMRKRLAEQLEKTPELKTRLHSLGWRNNSDDISHEKKINSGHSVKESSTVLMNGHAKGTILYKILIMGFENQEPDTDSPTKFTLSSFDQINSGATTPNFEVIDVMGGEISAASDEETSSENSTGQDVDTDRVLQLIPLVVEELREGLLSEEERRAFRWIFGKRLWELLEHEASKRLTERMDHDLAKFLFKGELPERDPESVRRGRHQRQNASARSKQKGHQRDFAHETKSNNEDYREVTKERTSVNFDEKKIAAGLSDSNDKATWYESRNLQENTKKKWNRYDYSDYDDYN